MRLNTNVQTLQAWTQFMNVKVQLENVMAGFKSVPNSFRIAHKSLPELVAGAKDGECKAQLVKNITIATEICDEMRAQLETNSKWTIGAEPLELAREAFLRFSTEAARRGTCGLDMFGKRKGAEFILDLSGAGIEHLARSRGGFDQAREQTRGKEVPRGKSDVYDGKQDWQRFMDREEQAREARREREAKNAPPPEQDQDETQSESESNEPLPTSPPAILDIDHYFGTVATALSDCASLTSFPEPPAFQCINPSCVATQSQRALRACPCNIRHVFGEQNLKAERVRFHPDKFAMCPAEVRADFQQYAKEIFVVVDAMWKAKPKW